MDEDTANKFLDSLMNTKAVKEAMAKAPPPEPRKPLTPTERAVKTSECACQFMEGKYEQSAELARQLILDAPTHPVMQIFIISMQRQKNAGVAPQVMGMMLAKGIQDPWYKLLLNLTLGLAQPADVYGRAQNDVQRCEAHYYIWNRLVTLGQNEAAKVEFEAFAKCPGDCFEKRLVASFAAAATALQQALGKSAS